MKQAFNYPKWLIENAMLTHHGIARIDLSNADKTYYTISNIIRFLSLDQYIEVAVSNSNIKENSVGFELTTKGCSNQLEFQQAIQKFQEHIEAATQKETKLETEELIHEIKGIIAAAPADHTVFIGQTYSDEATAKAFCDLPGHWYYSTPSKQRYSEQVYAYFLRQGITGDVRKRLPRKRSAYEKHENNYTSYTPSGHYGTSLYLYAKPTADVTPTNREIIKKNIRSCAVAIMGTFTTIFTAVIKLKS